MQIKHLSLSSIVICFFVSSIRPQIVDCSMDDDVSSFTQSLPIPPGCDIFDATFFILKEPYKTRMEKGLSLNSPLGDSVVSLIDTIEGTKNDSSSRRCYYHQCFSKHHLGSIRTVCGLICCTQQPDREYLTWQKSLCDRTSQESTVVRDSETLVFARDWSLLFHIHSSSDNLALGKQCCTFDVYHENWQFIQCLAIFHPNFFLPVHMRFIETAKVLSLADALDKEKPSIAQDISSIGKPKEYQLFAVLLTAVFIAYHLPRHRNWVRSTLSFLFLVSFLQTYISNKTMKAFR